MTNIGSTGMALADFERLLEVYGGDRTRWPADARAAAAQLVARDAKARLVLAEAEALDRVLERAPLPSLTVEAALADRIVTAAQRSPRIVKVGGREPAIVLLPKSHASPRRWNLSLLRGDVRAASVLAASLVVGIVIGISSLPQSVVPALADLAGGERSGYNLALVEPLDEDVL